jgi:hypothetical protein
MSVLLQLRFGNYQPPHPIYAIFSITYGLTAYPVGVHTAFKGFKKTLEMISRVFSFLFPFRREPDEQPTSEYTVEIREVRYRYHYTDAYIGVIFLLFIAVILGIALILGMIVFLTMCISSGKVFAKRKPRSEDRMNTITNIV